MKITHDKQVPTGLIEVTDFTDTDRAISKYFLSYITRMHVTDTQRKENQEFAQFEKRDDNTKIHVGRFDTPQEFVKKLVQKLKGTDVNHKRSELFPVFYISRDPSIVFTDGTDYADIHHQGDITDGDNNVVAIINKSFTKLNYTLTALAWNQSTADRMGLGVMMFARYGKHKTTAKTLINNTPITVNIEFNVPQNLMASPLEVAFSDSRLFGMSFSFEVITEVFEAVSTQTKTSTLTIADEFKLLR